MHYKLLAVSALCLLSINTAAHETEIEHEGRVAPVHEETGFYTALKAQITTGKTIEKNDKVDIEGHTGKGIGVEVGYKVGYGFAIEGDGTFSRNTLTEVNCETGTCEKTNADGEYMTVSLDLVYKYELTHHFGTFVKTGYEYETETIEKLDEKGYDTGVIYAAGVEYAVGEHSAFMAEYEGTTIDGPRGNSIFAGVLYHF